MRFSLYVKIQSMSRRILVFIGSFFLATLACSLQTETPPTLAPSTPMSTITPDAAIVPPTLVPGDTFNVPTPQPIVPDIEANIVRPSSIDMVDAGRMMADINTLVGFQTRHVLSTASPTTGIEAAQNWLLATLRSIAETSPIPYENRRVDVFPHGFTYQHGGQQVITNNVIMTIQGTDASAGVVMVTAHYDTALRDWFDGNSFQPGANDNGSGVAALLEMARILVQTQHRATLAFVFFSGEETGRQGSQAFVSDYVLSNNIPLVAVVNLDIIGSPDGRNGERYDNWMRIYSEGPNANSPSRQLARMAHIVVDRYVPEMRLEVQDRVDRANRWGDHMSFSEQGYPSIRMIEASDDSTIAHTTRDTIDRIDPTYLRRTTQAGLAVLELMIDGQNAPTLRPLRPSENDPATLVLEWSFNPLCQSYIVALRGFDSLVYDDFRTVEGNSLAWGSFKNFEAVSVACVDQNGQLGRFSPEIQIPQT